MIRMLDLIGTLLLLYDTGIKTQGKKDNKTDSRIIYLGQMIPKLILVSFTEVNRDRDRFQYRLPRSKPSLVSFTEVNRDQD